MLYYPISGFLNSIISILCGLVIYLHNPKASRNRYYALFTFLVAFWSFFYGLWQLAEDPKTALLFTRAMMMGAIFIPVLTFHYTLVLFSSGTPGRRRFIQINYLLAFLYALTNFTTLFISGVEQRLDFKYWPIPGPVFHPYLANFILLVLGAVYLIYEFKSKASPIMKNRLNWIGTATIIAFVCGSSNFPLWYNVPLAPYLNGGTALLPLVGALLFFRLGHIEFKLFLKNTFVYFLTTVFICVSYFLILYSFVEDKNFLFISAFIVGLVPLLYQPLSKLIRRVIGSTVLGKVDQYLTAVERQISTVRETTFTYEDLAENLIRSIARTFPVESVSIYFHELSGNQLILQAQLGLKSKQASQIRYNRPYFAISLTHPLVQRFQSHREPIILEELRLNDSPSQEDKKIIAALEKREGEICLPFVISNQVKGLMILGRKMSGEMFHVEDLQTLVLFRRMGQDILRNIMGMEHEVYYSGLYSHDMSNDTKSLAQTLQFLQSPLATKLSADQKKELLKNSEDVATRLNQSFQLNRDRSKLILKSLKGEYDKQRVDITKLVEISTNKYIIPSEKLNVQLHHSVPNESLIVMGHSGDLIRVVDNLISNALRYVKPSGHVWVGLQKKGADEVALSVEDDGEGIKEEDIKKIWEHGWQAKDAKEGAAGFGLAITRQIIHLHSGDIQVERGRNNKGAKFNINLPLHTKNERIN